LKRGNDDGVSCNAVENPNCPPEAKIKWMQATGKIEKEDPTFTRKTKNLYLDFDGFNQAFRI
jgi:hypothetical protein